MKFDVIHSDFSFSHQMMGYQAIIEICPFQLTNNRLATEISPFLRARQQKVGFCELKGQLHA